MFGFDPLYFVWLAPGLTLALWAQWHTQRAFRQGRAVALHAASQVPRRQRKSCNLQALPEWPLSRARTS